MATGGFDPNCIVPVSSQITVGASAVPFKSSSTLSIKFSVSNPGALAIYIGDSNVSATRYLARLSQGTTVTFGPDELFKNQQISHDLARYYAYATASSQTLNLIIYSKGGNNGPF